MLCVRHLQSTIDAMLGNNIKYKAPALIETSFVGKTYKSNSYLSISKSAVMARAKGKGKLRYESIEE